MSTFFRANATAILEPGIRKVVNTSLDYRRRSEQFSRVMNVLSSEMRNEEDRTFSGLGTMPEKIEGEEVDFDTPIQGYQKIYTHATYALGFRVTREMKDDDLYGQIMKMSRALGISAVNANEVVAADVFNNAFTAGASAGPDGVALCSTAHPLLAGGTESNRLAVDSDLSESSLETAITLLEDTVDDRNIPLGLMSKTLLVQHTNKFTARRLINSQLQAETGNNAINAFRDENLGIAVWQYLTDPDAWFLLADRHEVNYFWRMRPLLESDTEFGTGDSRFKITQRFSVGFTDFRGVIGTPGA